MKVTGMIIGRSQELKALIACLKAEKNILLEGPVGVGKTYLAREAARLLKLNVFRVDGDHRFTEQKMTGWYDPSRVLKEGYIADAYMQGPLVQAMQTGGLLFINELNRLPDAVQNVLLPALDERVITIPRWGECKAQPGFRVIATQNPKEFVATTQLSEALLDRFELIVLDYPTQEEEIAMVESQMRQRQCADAAQVPLLAWLAVSMVRATRQNEKVTRGASIRAALSIAEIAAEGLKSGGELRNEIISAAKLALPNRIELEREFSDDGRIHDVFNDLIESWADMSLATQNQIEEHLGKKKS